MEAQTETKSPAYRVPPPAARVAPGVGASQLLSVRLGTDRVMKVKERADAQGKTPAQYVRWLIDLVP